MGRCTQCDALSSFSIRGEDFQCDHCRQVAYRCSNQTHNVCRSFTDQPDRLRRWCDFTSVIPNLDSPESVRRWAVLETAKRRLLLQVAELGLPQFTGDLQQFHPLSFEFLEDFTDENGIEQSVTTGHQDGVITINLAEVDSVHRERLRVQLNEPHRTLIGHMRHEIGHYIDWSWASRVAPAAYHQLFGDPGVTDYGESMR